MDGSERERKSERGGRPHSGRVTMEAVGRIAGVSQVTVSRALSDPSKVSPGTLERIREAIEVTGFVPNAIAGALASRRTRLITALVPSITNIVYSSMVKAFGDEIRDHGYQILLSETGFAAEDEEALISTHLSRRPDAVLLTGIHHTARTRRMLLGAGTPVVELWDITDSPIDLCVGFSHVEAGRAVADFAAERGHVRAGCVSANDERALRRKDAFAQRFSRRTGGDVMDVILDGPASLAGGREGLSRLIDQHGFDGGMVFCSSDLLAHGLMTEAHARGLPIPDQVAIFGFGDQDFAAHTAPGITTVRVDREALGRTAAQAILARLNGEKTASSAFDIGFEIVRRGSA